MSIVAEERHRVPILGLPFDNVTKAEALLALERFVDSRRFHFIATPDMWRTFQVSRDDRLRRLYEDADLLVSDGTAVVLASRLLGQPLRGRAPCPDLLHETLCLAAKRGWGVFLVRGGDAAVTRAAAEEIARRYPGISAVNEASVSFDFDPQRDCAQSDQVIRNVAEARPAILLLALGFPKEELWAAKLRGPLANVPVCLGIGGAAEILAGRRKRAPRLLRRFGLEWVFRLACEPRRLAHRYLVTGPAFCWAVARQWARGARAWSDTSARS